MHGRALRLNCHLHRKRSNNGVLIVAQSEPFSRRAFCRKTWFISLTTRRFRPMSIVQPESTSNDRTSPTVTLWAISAADANSTRTFEDFALALVSMTKPGSDLLPTYEHQESSIRVR